MSSKDPKDNFKEVIDHFKKINQLTNDHPQATNDRPQSSKKIEEKDSQIPEKIEKKDLEYEADRLNNVQKQSLIELQKDICYWVRWVVSIYLAVVGFILLVLLFGEGNLDTSVIIALLTTTTINILGLPWLIIRSLFPPEEKSKEKKS